MALHPDETVTEDDIEHVTLESFNIVTKEGNEENEGVKTLVDVLRSEEIVNYINDTYDGAVIPFTE